MNDALDILNTVLDAIVGVLAVGLRATARAMLANVHTSEWASALALAVAVWLLAGHRGKPALALGLFLVAVGAGVWLSWKTGHTGVTAQQAVMVLMVLYSLKGRGWTLAKGSTR